MRIGSQLKSLCWGALAENTCSHALQFAVDFPIVAYWLLVGLDSQVWQTKLVEIEHVSFLGWPVEHRALSERTRRRRKATALRIIRRFAETFVGIEYDLLWENPTINAQAWRFGEERHVTVCGGLVRHSLITVSGIALMLAHETGHHLGGPPFDPDLRYLTWQGQADYWAANEGMPMAFGHDARRIILRGAREIAGLHAEFLDDQPDLSAKDRLTIFRAGAQGESPPACLREAFNRLLEQRRAYSNFAFA